MGREAARDDDRRRPGLLMTAMGAGHGGTPGRFDRLEEVARTYAFAIAVVEGKIGEAGSRPLPSA